MQEWGGAHTWYVLLLQTGESFPICFSVPPPHIPGMFAKKALWSFIFVHTSCQSAEIDFFRQVCTAFLPSRYVFLYIPGMCCRLDHRLATCTYQVCATFMPNSQNQAPFYLVGIIAIFLEQRIGYFYLLFFIQQVN